MSVSCHPPAIQWLHQTSRWPQKQRSAGFGLWRRSEWLLWTADSFEAFGSWHGVLPGYCGLRCQHLLLYVWNYFPSEFSGLITPAMPVVKKVSKVWGVLTLSTCIRNFAYRQHVIAQHIGCLVLCYKHKHLIPWQRSLSRVLLASPTSRPHRWGTRALRQRWSKARALKR